MNIEDSNDFQRVVAFFWGEHNAQIIPKNEHSVTAVIEVLDATGACSDMMDMVPRPHTSLAKPAYSYALKQIKRIAKDLISGNSSTYISCKNTVALAYRTRIAEIVNGIH